MAQLVITAHIGPRTPFYYRLWANKLLKVAFNEMEVSKGDIKLASSVSDEHLKSKPTYSCPSF